MKSRLKKLSFLPAAMLALLPASGIIYATPIKPPTLTITAPKNEAATTNGAFLVTGDVAMGSLAVSNVLVSVNAGAWTAASMANTNWQLQVNLAAGTNTVSAYAADVMGNPSVTNTVKLLYAVPALFTLQLVGEGTVTPALNGKELDLGVNYTLTAKGTNGCVFDYWSGGVPTSTNSKVAFTMTEGLSVTANFRDITPPTLAITAPKAGETYTNAALTVTGTAKDNVAVAAVNVQANSSGWVTASGTNNWSAGLSLSPGTNVVAAYAIDQAGNHSATNAVKVFYAVPALFTLQIIGEGTVAPALNGQKLNLGVNYTLTAKGTNGCVFYYWGGGVTMTTNSKITFTMTEGLSVTAHFEDVTPPTLSITAPKAGENYSNSTITVAGKASDNVAVAEVNAQINGGGWVTASGTTAWSAVLPVVTGDNLVEAYAVDQAGNNSKTNEVAFTGYPPQANWAPVGVTNSLIMLEPILPTTGAQHYLCFSTKMFSYSDTNLLSPDSGIGNHYAYIPWETNYAEVQLAFTAPPAVNTDTADLDLAFTNFNAGYYTNYSNEAANEMGRFYIVSAQQLAPTNWSGKSYTGRPLENTTTATTVTFTSVDTFAYTRNSTTEHGLYVVDNVSRMGAFFELNFTNSATPKMLYLQLTFTSKTNGFYEGNDYLNGTEDYRETGTFK